MRRPLIFLAALTGVPVVIAWFLSEQVIHPRRRVEDHDLDDFDLPAEPVSSTSRAGPLLAGWFIPPRGAARPAPGVVLSHGWARSRCELLPHAGFLHGAGYAVLMFDYRNRGLSEGESITMGVKERGDLLAAIDVLEARPEVGAARQRLLRMRM